MNSPPNYHEHNLVLSGELETKLCEMADTDVTIQKLVLWVVVPLFLLFIARNLFRDHITAFRKWLFAYFINRTITKLNKMLGSKKQKLFADLSDFLRGRENGGIVLEIGAGGGANFQFYPEGCTVTCLEPNEYFKGYLEDNAQKHSHFKYNGCIVADARNMKVSWTTNRSTFVFLGVSYVKLSKSGFCDDLLMVLGSCKAE